MSALTGWKFLVNFLLPPPMLLTFLLVLPFPRNVRKGVLLFTNKVLSFSVLGGMKLVHLALILSGVPLIDSGLRTFKIAKEVTDLELTPNQKIGVLAKKWREERNFWIAAMTFTLWCLLTVLYAQVTHAMLIHDRLDALQDEMDDIKGIKREKPAKALKMTGLGRFGRGRKGGATAEEPATTEITDATTEEVEMTAAGDLGAGGPTTRRRAAAVKSE